MRETVEIYYDDGMRQNIPSELWEEERNSINWDCIKTIVDNRYDVDDSRKTNVMKAINKLREKVVFDNTTEGAISNLRDDVVSLRKRIFDIENIVADLTEVIVEGFKREKS